MGRSQTCLITIAVLTGQVVTPGSRSARFVVAFLISTLLRSWQQTRLRKLSVRSKGISNDSLVSRCRLQAKCLSGSSLRGEAGRSNGSLSRLFQSSTSKAKNAFLLVACTFGRLSLGVLRALRPGIPRRLQLSVSANILKNVGNLLIDTEIASKPISDNRSNGGGLYPGAVEKAPIEGSDQSVVAEDISRALNISLPNDLSRLIFLATLRDNNSGHYYHPEVARRFSGEVADRAMLVCHRRIYEQVVALAIEDLTDQLDVYIATVPVPRGRLIESWTKLKAYRATIPMDTDPIAAEIFFMKVDVAVAILEARLPGKI